jgi:hypothetical protein
MKDACSLQNKEQFYHCMPVTIIGDSDIAMRKKVQIIPVYTMNAYKAGRIMPALINLADDGGKH